MLPSCYGFLVNGNDINSFMVKKKRNSRVLPHNHMVHWTPFSIAWYFQSIQPNGLRDDNCLWEIQVSLQSQSWHDYFRYFLICFLLLFIDPPSTVLRIVHAVLRDLQLQPFCVPTATGKPKSLFSQNGRKCILSLKFEWPEAIAWSIECFQERVV